VLLEDLDERSRLSDFHGDQRRAFREFALLTSDERPRLERPLLCLRYRANDSVEVTFWAGLDRTPYVYSFIEKRDVDGGHSSIKAVSPIRFANPSS